MTTEDPMYEVDRGPDHEQVDLEAVSSFATDQVLPALMAVWSELTPALKDRDLPAALGGRKYATLNAVYDACEAPLRKAGLFPWQFATPMDDPGVICLVTRLVHVASGQWLQNVGQMKLKDPSNPNAYGSALTYLRRYSLLTLLLLRTEDDDGQHARREPGQAGTTTETVAARIGGAKANSDRQAFDYDAWITDMRGAADKGALRKVAERAEHANLRDDERYQGEVVYKERLAEL